MIVLGIILIIVGAALFYFFAEPIVRFIAAVLALLGLVLVVLAVLDASDVDTASYGTGRMHASYGTGRVMASVRSYGTG